MFGALKGLKLPPGVLDALVKGQSEADQRKAFMAVLVATAANVGQKPNFNLELELNDLWTRLTALREQKSGGLGKVVQNVQKVFDASLFNMLNKSLEALAKSDFGKSKLDR